MATPITPIPGFEEPVSSLLHLAAAGAFLCAAPALIRRGHGERVRQVGLGVFAATSVVLLAISGTYHLLPRGTDERHVLRLLDHAAIFALIAGTFTAGHVVFFRGIWRWGMIALIWALALTGIAVKTTFFHELPSWLGLSFYLGIGWIGVVSAWKGWRLHGREPLKPIFVGGACYTVGAISEFLRIPTLWPGVIGPHELFHVAVIGGLACHWAFLYRYAQLLDATKPATKLV